MGKAALAAIQATAGGSGGGGSGGGGSDAGYGQSIGHRWRCCARRSALGVVAPGTAALAPSASLSSVEFETVSWEYWDHGWNKCHPGMAQRLNELLRDHKHTGYHPECEWVQPGDPNAEYLLNLEDMTQKRYGGPCRHFRRIVITHCCEEWR